MRILTHAPFSFPQYCEIVHRSSCNLGDIPANHLRISNGTKSQDESDCANIFQSDFGFPLRACQPVSKGLEKDNYVCYEDGQLGTRYSCAVMLS